MKMVNQQTIKIVVLGAHVMFFSTQELLIDMRFQQQPDESTVLLNRL